MLLDLIFGKKEKKKIDPEIRVYKRIWYEERLLLLKSVPVNMLNLSYWEGIKLNFVNYFKFMSMPSFFKWMALWLICDILIFNYSPACLFIMYIIALKCLVFRIFFELAWKKHYYFNNLKYEIIKKSYKDEIFLLSVVFFVLLMIFFLDPSIISSLF